VSKKSVLENHKKFENDIESIIKYGMEIIYAKSPYKKEKRVEKEKFMLLEALLLRSCALWESFMENEVVFLVNLEPNNLKNEMGLPKNTKLNLKLIRAIIFSDRYRDYYNIEQSRSNLNKIIADRYNLSKNIEKERIEKISFIYKMRNYLSHYSAFSRKKLFIAYQNMFNYKKFQEPGAFLMKQKGKYFESLIHNFKLVSISMKQKLKEEI